MNAPGSPSSPLQMTYFGSSVSGTNDHFLPVGKPPPPLPLKPDLITSSMTSLRDIFKALFKPWNAPIAKASSMFSGSISALETKAIPLCCNL